VRSLFAAVPLLLSQEVSHHLEIFSLGIVKGLHYYTTMIAINSSTQKTDQSCPASYNIEAIKNVKDQAALEVVCLKPREEQLCMAIEPEVIREMKCHGKSHISLQTFCLKRNQQAVFWFGRILKMSAT
jgi:hypothetical protein